MIVKVASPRPLTTSGSAELLMAVTYAKRATLRVMCLHAALRVISLRAALRVISLRAALCVMCLLLFIIVVSFGFCVSVHFLATCFYRLTCDVL